MTTPRTASKAKGTARRTAKTTAGAGTGTAGRAGAPARPGSTAPEAVGSAGSAGPLTGHCDDLLDALVRFRDEQAAGVEDWGRRLAKALAGGGRLLAAGNGGSAAQAQHLTAELVGRYRDERPAYSAIALHADTSTTTAIANDYGVDELFARQVRAHGRRGDVLVLLSTSGASANLLSAAEAGREAGMAVWALTGPAPNPLAAGCDEALCVRADSTATVQELHLVAVHMLCAAFDAALADLPEGGDADGAAEDA
ncbi:SIS domain-containing protein [Streptomyces sp. TRM 70361]|uniref:D-sedoheptulose-7-phosphate isomerase n=1 Tax=Streptomyces sp. TRM 70361 TaxID=3116553 RepID=UPI002E7ADB13|nr:SIS domain-containing protein [Streptomyces sp. TRM 70361]MEE1942107.1 SIS domain-containing protein [Streptomyces sp. TRM 70361]